MIFVLLVQHLGNINIQFNQIVDVPPTVSLHIGDLLYLFHQNQLTYFEIIGAVPAIGEPIVPLADNQEINNLADLLVAEVEIDAVAVAAVEEEDDAELNDGEEDEDDGFGSDENAVQVMVHDDEYYAEMGNNSNDSCYRL